MTKNIWYIGKGRDDNYDDFLLQESVMENITKLKDVRFTYVDGRYTVWTQSLIEKLNKEADMLLICGEIISRKIIPYHHSGWLLNIRLDDIDSIKVPIVGYNIDCNNTSVDNKIEDCVWDHVGKVINKAALFATANKGSYDEISKHVSTKKMEIVPLAGAIVSPTNFARKCFVGDKVSVGLSLEVDYFDKRFGNQALRKEKMELFINIIADMANKHNMHIYLIEHDPINTNNRLRFARDELVNMAASILKENISVVMEGCREEFLPPSGHSARFLIDFYRRMDFVIGMRESANMIAFGQGVPSIGAGNSCGVRWNAEHMGLDNLIIDLSINDAELYKRSAGIVGNVISDLDTYKRAIDMRKTELEYVNSAFLDRLSKIL